MSLLSYEERRKDMVEKQGENEKEETGATMIEYALLIVLIAIIAIAALRFLGQRVSKQFSGIAMSISS
jgi:Flp pilus assembly pilin Flp